jgi:hypothetical protein
MSTTQRRLVHAQWTGAPLVWQPERICIASIDVADTVTGMHLYLYRLKSGHSAAAVARCLGIPTSVLIQIEAGETIIPVAIADVLHD